MRLNETITGAFNSTTRLPLPRALLAVLLSTQAGCGPFEDASNVPGMACAESIMVEDNSDWSGRVELFDGIDEGTGDNANCSVRSYTAVDPQSLDPLDEDKLDKYLDRYLAAFTYPDESVVTAFNDEVIVAAQLTDSCEDFGLPSGSNFCVQTCTYTEEPMRLVVTDGCENVVGVDGKAYDLLPAPSAADSE